MLSDDRDTASVGASRKSWKEVVIRIRYINIYIDITSVLLATKKTVLSSVNDVEVYGLHKLLSLSLSPFLTSPLYLHFFSSRLVIRSSRKERWTEWRSSYRTKIITLSENSHCPLLWTRNVQREARIRTDRHRSCVDQTPVTRYKVTAARTSTKNRKPSLVAAPSQN